MKVSELRMLCPSILTHSKGGTNFFLSSLEAIQLPHLPEKMESQLMEERSAVCLPVSEICLLLLDQPSRETELFSRRM